MVKIKKLILTGVLVATIIGLGLFVYGLFDTLYECDMIGRQWNERLCGPQPDWGR